MHQNDPAPYHVWTPSDNPLLVEKNYKLQLRGSEALWVILGPRALPESKFAFYKSAQSLPGSLLFVLTLREDFYQGMLEALLDLVSRVAEENRIRKIIYVGFSAGAYAALVLGLRGKYTHRIVAFAPQFRLDDALSIADRTVKPPTPGAPRFDKRYVDILDEVKNATTRCDVFLGVHDFYDGVIVAEALEIRNSLVTVHYVRSDHDVGGALSGFSSLAPIVSSSFSDGDREVFVPGALRGDAEDAKISVRVYELARALEYGETPEIPQDPDENYSSPYWWNVKSRVRFRRNDIFGAIGDICHAISLDPKSGGHYVCAGHYFRDCRLFEFAETAYKRAAHINPDNWQTDVALSGLYLSQGRIDEADRALSAAISKNAPDNHIAPLQNKLRDAAASAGESNSLAQMVQGA